MHGISLDRRELIQVGTLLSSRKNRSFLRSLLAEPEGFPISIFRSSLSPLETTTKFLIEHKKLTVRIAAGLLNRSESSLYTTYTAAKKKSPEPLDVSDTSIVLPYVIFSDRSVSILETLVAYLRDERGLSLKRISQIVGRSYGTIKSVYWRHARKKK